MSNTLKSLGYMSTQTSLDYIGLNLPLRLRSLKIQEKTLRESTR